MACCVLAAMIIAQVFESWRQFRAFLRSPATITIAATPALLARLRPILSRRISKMILIAALCIEVATAGTWLVNEHRDHLLDAVQEVEKLAGMRVQPLVAMCRSRFKS